MLPTMAQLAQNDDTEPPKWTLGASCSLFNWRNRTWNEAGTIVGSFSDENGEWLKVQSGSEIHEILADGPDVRVMAQQKSSSS